MATQEKTTGKSAQLASGTASKPTEAATAAKPAEMPKASTAAAKLAAKATPTPGQCVVDDGTPHVGRAVNGLVCSRHAVNYKGDGTRR